MVSDMNKHASKLDHSGKISEFVSFSTVLMLKARFLLGSKN